jgi:hypothetical protein
MRQSTARSLNAGPVLHLSWGAKKIAGVLKCDVLGCGPHSKSSLSRYHRFVLLIHLIYSISDRAPYVEYSGRHWFCLQFFSCCGNLLEKDSKAPKEGGINNNTIYLLPIGGPSSARTPRWAKCAVDRATMSVLVIMPVSAPPCVNIMCRRF